MADSGITPNPDPNEPSVDSFTSTQGTDLGSVGISEVYRDLLTINNSSNNNEGLSGSLKYLRDGAGFSLPIQVSQTEVSIDGDLYVDDLHIANTINLDNISQFLLQVPTSVTGSVFKIKNSSGAIFSVDNEGSVNCRSLDLEQTATDKVTPSEGQIIWDGADLQAYLPDKTR